MSRRPPVTDWATDFDHLDPRWVENPYPIWDELRQKCPIAHTDRFMGVYLPTRYEDVRAVAYDTEHFSSHRVVVRESLPPKGGAPPITTDPPKLALLWSAECVLGLRDLAGLRAHFDAVIDMLAEGIATRRGRKGAFLHRDQVNGIVRGRRGARLAAITSGGAIPDNAQYFVVAEPATSDGPESLLTRREVANTLGKALGALSPEQRAVVELTYYYELSYGEIAEIVGCPVNTVKTRMFHARRRLKNLLPGLGIDRHTG